MVALIKNSMGRVEFYQMTILSSQISVTFLVSNSMKIIFNYKFLSRETVCETFKIYHAITLRLFSSLNLS